MVIHLDYKTTLDQADLAFEAGADGIFLISHQGEDAEDIMLSNIGQQIKSEHKTKLIGLNLLGYDALHAAKGVLSSGLDMVWSGYCGVSSDGVSGMGLALQNMASKNPEIMFFASVAFKYQKTDTNPPLAASMALNAGFIPTTSGSATGNAPSIEKIAAMSKATNGKLAIASGMSVENIESFAPYLSHVLVATGVSVDEHHFDFELLSRFISLAKKSISIDQATRRQ